MRFQLAGADIRKGGGGGYDAKTGHQLIYTGDCDGASIDLILMPDKLPKDPDQGWFDDWQRGGEGQADTRTRKGSLPRLRTGYGVNIGESPSVVQRKLGAGPQSLGGDGNVRIWTYYAVVTTGAGKQRATKNYRADYLFYKNKLWGIQYNLSRPEGC